MVASVMGVHRASTRNPLWHVASLLFAAWVMALLDRLIITILVPGLKTSLHLSDTQISILHGPTFAIVYALAGVPVGWLVDRGNRRNLLALGLVGWSLATMASGLVNSFGALIAARMVVGVCQAVVAPASLSMVVDCCPDERRGSITAFLVSGASVGAAASSMLGGIVVDFFAAHPLTIPFAGHLAPWQPTLFIAGAPGLVVALALLTVHEPDRRGRAAGPAFKILPYLWRHRTAFAPLYAAFALAYVASYGSAFWFPVILMRNMHMPAHEAGIAAGFAALIGGPVSAVGGGYLSDRFARRDRDGGRLKLIIGLYILTALAFLPALIPHQPFWAVASLFASGTIATIASAITFTIVPELAPNEGRGQAITLFLLLGYLVGLGTAPTAIALITDQVFRNELMVNLSMLIVCIPSLLLSALLVQIGRPAARRLRRAIAEAEA